MYKKTELGNLFSVEISSASGEHKENTKTSFPIPNILMGKVIQLFIIYLYYIQ